MGARLSEPLHEPESDLADARIRKAYEAEQRARSPYTSGNCGWGGAGPCPDCLKRAKESVRRDDSDTPGDPPFRDSLFDVCVAASKGWTRILEGKTFTDAELQTLELLLAEATFHVIRLRTPKDVAF